MVSARKFADYTGAILIEEPTSASGIQTFKVGDSITMSGSPVTGYGCAQGVCSTLSSSDWPAIGVVLDDEVNYLDKYYITNGEIVTVAMRGSNAVVWVLCANTTEQFPGTEYYASDDNTGTVIAGAGNNKAIGVLVEYAAADSWYQPIKIRLSC